MQLPFVQGQGISWAACQLPKMMLAPLGFMGVWLLPLPSGSSAMFRLEGPSVILGAGGQPISFGQRDETALPKPWPCWIVPGSTVAIV